MSAVDILFPITDRRWVPAERYLSDTFFDLERDRLWSRAWQMACRLEEIPEVGDFVEYEICDQSVLVVRTGLDEVKGYFNACRHRATQLAMGSGRFRGGQIVCPFHGWRWNLDGSISSICGADGFDPECLADDDVALRQCRVGTWAGCVWISMDPAAPSLAEALAPISSLLDPLDLDRMRVRWWKSVVLAANWKLAQEAFMEGLHVMQTHPQLTLGRPEAFNPDAQAYFVHPNGHSHFQNAGARLAQGPLPAKVIDAVIQSARLLRDGLDSMTITRDLEALEGLQGRTDIESLTDATSDAVYGRAEADGVRMPERDADAIARWGGVFFVFPNFFVLPQYGNALIYRSRPNGTDPESCLFELWSVSLFPEGREPGRPVAEGPFSPEDEEAWPEIPLQDFSNIERQQHGLHTKGFEAMRLSGRYEGGIANMHVELDRYLSARGPTSA